MIGNTPPRPVGNTPEANNAKATWDKVHSGQNRPQEHVGQKVNRTTRGFSLFTPTQRTAVSEKEERLFNLSNYTIYGSPSWDLSTFDTRDLGASFAGFEEIEDKIKSALNDGRRIRTALGIRVQLSQITPSVEASVNFSIGLYAGAALYNVSSTCVVHADATNATFLQTYRGELILVQAGGNVVIPTEADAVYSSQQTATDPLPHIPWLNNLSSDAFTDEVTNVADGKLIGKVASLINATGAVGFHHLTIDSLPPIG